MASAADSAALRRAALRIGGQAAALVAVTVALLAVVAGLVIVHQQNSAGAASLVAAVSRSDSVDGPPTGVWLTFVRPGDNLSTPGIPAGLPVAADLTTVAAGGQSVERTVTVGGVRYRVLTAVAEQGVVQADLDLSQQSAERGRLLTALLSVGVLGLLLAVVTGTLFGRRAVRPLAEALALQRRFVADASHELRTPLTLLSTRAQVHARAVARAGGDEQLVRGADGVVSDAARLAAIVDDLLLAADPRPVRTEVDVTSLAADVVAGSEDYAASRGVRLVFAGGGPAVLLGQPTGLRRSLTALVDNAVEHSPNGGLVTVACATDGGEVRLSVTDEGDGVDPAVRSELLGRFRSAGQSSNRRHYGLGLALAGEVAGRHDGRVDIAAAPGGKGSVFTLVLPRKS